MNVTKALMSTALTTLVSATPLLAATGARQDSSNALVWAFLGICALIIFLQMVPVISMAYGLFRGAFGRKAGLEDELETATSKYR